MDLVYIIGKGSRHNNIELRMSLRSICRFGSGIDNVIVAGCPPSWLSDQAWKVFVEDRYSYKHSNILRCIEQVVDMGLVKGDFLYSSDDHFYVRNVDFANYPFYIKSNQLRSIVQKTDDFYQYHKSLVDTRNLLLSHEFPACDYSQHCNTHMNADVVNEFRDIIHESYALPYGAEPTSLIMNIWSRRLNAPAVYTPRKDLKIVKAKTIDDIQNKIGSNECFSISDSVFYSQAITEFFKLMYGEKCKYETD